MGYTGKTTNIATFEKLKYLLPQSLATILNLIYAADTTSNIELLMLVIDFKVGYRLYITQRYLHEILNEDA